MYAISQAATRLPAALSGAALCLFAAAASAAEPSADTIRGWLQEMKSEQRGPFERIRWFCKDGTVLEPKPYACANHGGGVQHGEWSPRTKQIRAAGYPIATILAALKPDDIARGGAELIEFLLIEKYLVAADDGWIYRKAQYYRGAFQDYNERDNGTALLLALLARRDSLPYPVLREAVRLLPHGSETPAATQLRGLAGSLAERDPGFAQLRSKIHNAPDANDADRVRDYAASGKARANLKSEYERLAQSIDRLFSDRSLPTELRALARQVQVTAPRLNGLADELQRARDPEIQLRLAAETMLVLQELTDKLGAPQARLDALDASLSAESLVFAAGRTLLQRLPQVTRAKRLEWIGLAAKAVRGMELLNERELQEVGASLERLATPEVPLGIYRDEVQQLGRAAGWPARRMDYHFGDTVNRFAAIEPMARQYVADRLRGGAMLFYADVLDSLVEDADRLSGVRHSLFGQETSTGLRRLNPGLGRGTLRSVVTRAGTEPAIFLVPETVADLPPAAGILTAEEGNALSHVQLLARNLGIPNVVVGRGLLPALEQQNGRIIVVAASPGGVVRIEPDSGEWQRLLGSQKPGELHINVKKLDLSRVDFIPTSRLRASDSGRIVGPKAAQVGELERYFPEQVPPGLAIPFGVFRAMLERPVREGGPPMFEWLRAQYADLAQKRGTDPEAYARRLPEFLSFVRKWIHESRFPPGFRERLRLAMNETFGIEGTYGVFVRSDTNVEDLPGFTGAGLNLTVPNVTDFEEVLRALKRVWASPFTERAYGWRQALAHEPEHVYASVLLHRSSPNEKSGVMVTADIDTGAPEFVTVVTNLGVAGGVDGQAAETLEIELVSGEARLLASSTARSKRVLLPRGGSQIVPAPAPDRVLTPGEVATLVEFVRRLPPNYPGLRDADGRPAPADIEFGFLGGKLVLLQIRPFLQNSQAARNEYLQNLDAGLRRRGERRVDLRDVPERST